MPVFKKAILSSGKFMASKADGSRAAAAFTVKKLRAMAKTANEMIASGLNIPAPFDHNPAALPVTEMAATSFNNAGYWTKFWVSDEEGKPTLYGNIDAPGDITDPNTPAGKVGQTVKECSLSVRPEFTDGRGKKWSDPIMHVALCLHPIDYGQSNFEIAQDDMAISMSCMLSSDVNESDISTLREKLKTVANIFVPDTCDSQNLVSFLLVSLQQMELGKTSKSDDDDTVIEPAPVFLSLQENEMKLTKEQADSIVKSGAVNPATTKPYTLEDLGVQLAAPPVKPSADAIELQKKVDELTMFSAAMRDNLLQTKQATLNARIQALVNSRRVTKDYAEKHLEPAIAQVSLSFKDGKIAEHPLETTLAALEAIPAPERKGGLQFNLPSGASIHEPEDSVELSDEEMNAIADDLCSLVE